MLNLLAQVRPDDIFPFLLGAILFMIPIVAILTKHQQKMALLLRGDQAQNPQENDAVRKDVESVRQMVMQQTIAIDNLAASQRELAGRMSAAPTIEDRVRQES